MNSDRSDTGIGQRAISVWLDPGLWASLSVMFSAFIFGIILAIGTGQEIGYFGGFFIGVFAGDLSNWAKKKFTRGALA